MRKRTRTLLILTVLVLALAATAVAGWQVPWRQSCLGSLQSDSTPPDGLLTLPRDGYEAATDRLLPYVDVLRVEVESTGDAVLSIMAGSSMTELAVEQGRHVYETAVGESWVDVALFLDEGGQVTLHALEADNSALPHWPLLLAGTVVSLLLACLVGCFSGDRVRLHRVTFAVLMAGGVLIALLKPLNVYSSWDEQIHWEYACLLAGEAESLNAFLADFTTWNAGYWPNALGIALGRLLELDTGGVWLLGCLSGVAVYALLGALAVKIAPRYKLVFLLAAAMPTSLFLAASYSYDPMVIVSVLLGAAMVLRELSEPGRPLSPGRSLGMALTLCLGTLAKPAYSLLLLLMWLLPAGKLGSRGRLRAFRLMVLAVLLLCLAGMLLPGGYDGVRGGDERFEGTDSAAQLAWMLGNPLQFLRVLGHYLQTTGLSLYLSATASFAYLGALPWLYWPLLAGLLLSPLYAGEERGGSLLPGRRRAVLAVLGALPVLVLIVTQYVVSTAVGAGTIVGMQPRYTLPVLVLAALSLALPERLRASLRPASRYVGLAGTLWAVFSIGAAVYSLLLAPFYGL